MNRICKFAAYSMLAATLFVTPAFAQEVEEAEEVQNSAEAVEMTEADKTYVMPELAIDAERATYHALIRRPQDEVDKERIQLNPSNNPVKMLRSLNSSVTLGGGLGGSTVTPSIRGLSSKYTNVTIDGIPVNTPWNWSSVISGFPLNRLSKITLSNTGSAMVYGSNAVAGSINFSMPTAKDYEGFTLRGEVGGKGTRRTELMAGLVEDKHEHLVGIFKDDYDGQKRMANGVNFSNRSDNLTFYYKGQFNLGHGWKYKAMYWHSDGSISCADAWTFFQGAAHYQGLRFDPWKMSLMSHTIEKDLGNDSNISFRYSRYTDYSVNVDYDDPQMTLNPAPENGDTYVKIKTYDVLYNLKANDKNYVNVGIQKQVARDSHDSVSKDYQNKELDNVSFFIADSIRANDKLNIHLVARSDENYEGERDTSYSLNTSYDLTDKTTLGIGFSNTSMQPTIQDLYGAKGTYGNPNLENEKSKSYEIRLSHKINDDWNISLAGYKYDIDDKIYQKEVQAGSPMIGQNRWFRERNGNQQQWAQGNTYKVNVEEAEISGFEFAAQGKINDSLDLTLSYTKFNKSEYTENGRTYKLSDIPDYRAVIGLSYHHKKTSALLTASLQGEMEAIKGANGNIAYAKVDKSIITDFSIRQQCTKDFSVYAKCYNIGNKTNAIISQHYIANSGLARNTYWYEDGRTLIVGAELRLQ